MQYYVFMHMLVELFSGTRDVRLRSVRRKQGWRAPDSRNRHVRYASRDSGGVGIIVIYLSYFKSMFIILWLGKKYLNSSMNFWTTIQLTAT